MRGGGANPGPLRRLRPGERGADLTDQLRLPVGLALGEGALQLDPRCPDRDSLGRRIVREREPVAKPAVNRASAVDSPKSWATDSGETLGGLPGCRSNRSTPEGLSPVTLGEAGGAPTARTCTISATSPEPSTS